MYAPSSSKSVLFRDRPTAGTKLPLMVADPGTGASHKGTDFGSFGSTDPMPTVGATSNVKTTGSGDGGGNIGGRSGGGVQPPTGSGSGNGMISGVKSNSAKVYVVN